MTDFYHDEFVAAHYDVAFQGVPGDVDFYVGLAKQATPPVLELGCGTGRVAIPIARAGMPIVGLDRSEPMLRRARERSADLPNVRWLEGDMRDFSLEERFGLIIIPYRSFQHLMTVEEQKSALRCIHRHLVDDGRFALNIFNPDIVMMGRWMSERRGGVERQGSYRHPESGRQVELWASNEYRPSSQEARSLFLHEEVDREGAVVSKVHRRLQLRYIFRYEMEHLLALCGFRVEALYGDFSGDPFGDLSPEMVWIAARA